MLNAIKIVSIVVASLVLGCTASAQVGGSKSAVDWRAAYVSGPEVPVAHCDKNRGGEQAYYACLEELDRQRQQDVLASGSGGAKPVPTASAQPPAPVAPSATAPVAQLPLPMVGGYPTPQQVYIPGAAGPVCETNRELVYVITNDTNYLIEVRAGMKLAPLGCDAQDKLVLRTVVRRDGSSSQAWVIPPHTTAKYVFLPLNGGQGRPEVVFNAYLNLSCAPDGRGGMICPPATAVGKMERTPNVPRMNGEENFQTVTPSLLQIFGQ